MRAHPWLTATVVAVTAALLIVTLLGGWARSSPEGPAQAEPGTTVEAEPFRIRLDEASARFVVNGDGAEPGQAYVVVEGQIELAAMESVAAGTLTDAITADLTDAYDQFGSPIKVPAPVVRVRADGSSLLGLGPGLAYDVEIVFIVAEQSVPRRMTVTLLEHTRRASALDGDLGWYDEAPVARVTLDVAPLPAVRPEPEGLR
ncbi:hypothetical protein [Nocardioides dongkuii]|uniref:hypothetical protein n=1 Tax=Nocardioides dongkuii TaxID=2760089 RepID=UPI0015FBA1D8|nr:hypothetical protein [Nocardioides dongkuii]